MKHLCALVVCALLVSPALLAQAPSNMTYQGFLTTSFGAPLEDGSYSLRFDLFGTSLGGASLWNETHSAVAIQRGTFAVLLGTTTSFRVGSPDSAFIEVTIQSGPGISSPYIFSPRTLLTSVPFAHKSDTAGVALVAPPTGTAGGDLTGAYPNPAIGNNAVTGAKIQDSTITGVDINSGSALRVGSVTTSAINVTGGIQLTNTVNPSNFGALFDGGGLVLISGNNNPMYFYAADSEKVRITPQGRVGIGTADPRAMLDVAGYAFSRAPVVVYDSAQGSGLAPYPGINISWVVNTRAETTLVEKQPNNYDFKLKRNGWYRITSTLIFQGTPSPVCGVSLWKNSGEAKADFSGIPWDSTNNYASVHLSWILDSDGDDLVKLMVYAPPGGFISVFTGPKNRHQLSIEYLGAQ